MFNNIQIMFEFDLVCWLEWRDVLLPSEVQCRYIHYVKKHFKPVLTKESERVISSYYQLQRRSAIHNAG